MNVCRAVVKVFWEISSGFCRSIRRHVGEQHVFHNGHFGKES